MIGTLALKTAHTLEPVTTAEAKAHLRVDISDDDALIGNLIKTARGWIEDITGIRMVTQTWNYYLDSFPDDDIITLPIGPVTEVSSVKYTPEGGTVTTFSATSYETDCISLPARIALKSGHSWPTGALKVINGVDIEFIVGYPLTIGGTPAVTTPLELKQAVNLLVGHWYTNREAAAERKLEELPMAVQSLIANFRMWQREI